MRRWATSAGHARALLLCGVLLLAMEALAAAEAPLPRPKPSSDAKELTPLPRAKPSDRPGSREGAARTVALPPQFNPVEEPKPELGAPRSAQCLDALRADGVDAERARSYESKGHCVIDDPVIVRSVRGTAGAVTFPAAPLMDCRFASALTGWIKGIVAPVAAQVLSSPIKSVETGPGFVCRNMNSAERGKRSAHAIGNAVDLIGFRLTDGRRILIENYDRATGPEREFLVALRTAACGYFLTVLGPGSDTAHGNHLHVDIAQAGRSANYRICQ